MRVAEESLTSGLTDPLMSETEADRYWTTANSREAIAGVMTPLDWTFFSRGFELGCRRAYFDMGVLARRQVYLPTDTSESIFGSFRGRIALNVDFIVDLIDRIPGGSGAGFERDVFGTVREDVSRPGTDWARAPVMAVKLPLSVARNNKLITDNNDRLRAVWTRTVAALQAGTMDPLDGFELGLRESERATHLHARARFLYQMLVSQLAALATRAGMPESTHALTGAVRTEETAIVEDLWAVSRDALSVEDFLSRHGYHGPNEAAVSSVSWREDPGQIERTVAALRAQDAHDGPMARHEVALQRRAETEQRFVQRVGRTRRAAARVLLRLTRRSVVDNEGAKAGTLIATDLTRAATRLLAQQWVSRGDLACETDIFFLTVDELRAGTAPPNCAGLIAHRRARRQEYLGQDLPLAWHGAPEPLNPDDSAVGGGTTLTGLGVSSGTYTGIARVIHDPAVDDLDPGDVIICEVTDPSWMVSLSLAGALVLDIGGPSSHGAIVAREFGIPCVVNTTDGTRRIPNGAEVRVDGDAGAVEILADTGPTDFAKG